MNIIYDIIKKEIISNTTDNNDLRQQLLSHLNILNEQKLNILFVGATGVGKSSTINAIFDRNISTVGEWVYPETSVISKYEIDNLILWDSPGFGDSPENDKKYAKSIASLLTAKEDSGEFLIDAIVVILDASSRDMGTAYEMLNKIIIPYLGDKSRIVIAINKADLAMYGRNWDNENNVPNTVLLNHLEEKVSSVSRQTLDTLEALLNEVDKASFDKSRIISDIQNRDVQLIIQECSDYSLKHGIAGLSVAAGLGVAGAATGGIGAAAGGGIAAGGALAGGGLTAGGEIMGLVGGGAAAGSAVPIVGTLIGAGVGLLIGGLIGGLITAKKKQKRERLYQEAISKQNDQIKTLTKEVQSLQEKVNKKDSEIARLKYLVGVVSAYVGTKAVLTT